jgi:pilus assembly protein Flp/PilA
MARELHTSRRAQSGIKPKNHGGKQNMNTLLLKLYIKIQALLSQDEGQDLIEYALIVALIALACTAGMKALATAINTGFTNLGTTLTSSF